MLRMSVFTSICIADDNLCIVLCFHKIHVQHAIIILYFIDNIIVNSLMMECLIAGKMSHYGPQMYINVYLLKIINHLKLNYSSTYC